MNADSRAEVDVNAQFQVKAPHLGEITVAVFTTGVVFGTAGGLLIWRSLRRRRRVA